MALVCGSMFMLFYRFCMILSTDCFAVVLCEKMAKPPPSSPPPHSTFDFVPSSPSRVGPRGVLGRVFAPGGSRGGEERSLGREGGSRGEVSKMRGWVGPS